MRTFLKPHLKTGIVIPNCYRIKFKWNSIQRPSTTWFKPTFSILIFYIPDCTDDSLKITCPYSLRAFKLFSSEHSPSLSICTFIYWKVALNNFFNLSVSQFSYFWNENLTSGLIWGFNEVMHIKCLTQNGQAVLPGSWGWVSFTNTVNWPRAQSSFNSKDRIRALTSSPPVPACFMKGSTPRPLILTDW